MTTFSQFLKERSKDYPDGPFTISKGKILLGFFQKTARKDGKKYIQFVSAEPKEGAPKEEVRSADFLNQFGKKCNLFPSKRFNHQGVGEIRDFLENSSFKDIYDEIYRLRNSKESLFTKNDINFRKSYIKSVKQDSFIIQDDGSVSFPIIGKQNVKINVPEDFDSAEQYLMKIERDFRSKENANFTLLYDEDDDQSTISENETEDANADTPADDTQDNAEWQEREKLVANNIDSAIKELQRKNNISDKGTAGAEVRGGGNQSDVIVTSGSPGNGADFYVEVKLDYKSAAYLKFNVRYDGHKIVRTKNDQKDQEFNQNFSDMLTNIVMHNLERKFKLLKERVKYWISSFRAVTKNNEKLKNAVVIDESNATKFPDAFDELAKAFNFFILEWVNKFQVCKSEYMYNIVVGNTAEASAAATVARRFGKKIKQLSNGERITSMDAFQKFRSMYKQFISTDKTKITNKNRYVLFSFDTQEFEGKDGNPDAQNSKTRDELIELIKEYYNSKMGVEYIQVDDDLYKIKAEDPFGLNVPMFDSLKSIYQKSGNLNSAISMDVRVVGANTLHLDMRLSRPDKMKTDTSFVGKQNNLFTYKDIGKGDFYNSIVGKRNAR